jgi:hypothetical protein
MKISINKAKATTVEERNMKIFGTVTAGNMRKEVKFMQCNI